MALYELQRLIENGLSDEDFEDTRDYLMKNLFIMTKTQDQQLGYALDSRWYGMGEYVEAMRSRLAGLNLEAVNAAIRRHLSVSGLSVVMIAPDPARLREELLGPPRLGSPGV